MAHLFGKDDMCDGGIEDACDELREDLIKSFQKLLPEVGVLDEIIKHLLDDDIFYEICNDSILTHFETHLKEEKQNSRQEGYQEGEEGYECCCSESMIDDDDHEAQMEELREELTDQITELENDEGNVTINGTEYEWCSVNEQWTDNDGKSFKLVEMTEVRTDSIECQ